ncbi:MAG: hypothetical protein MK000_02980 [Anaerolineales bacterium]|nr:hypothetical protein [Anaerolineales bacterium]
MLLDRAGLPTDAFSSFARAESKHTFLDENGQSRYNQRASGKSACASFDGANSAA